MAIAKHRPEPKPDPWNVSAAMLEDEWRWSHEGLLLLCPFWDRGGASTWDVVSGEHWPFTGTDASNIIFGETNIGNSIVFDSETRKEVNLTEDNAQPIWNINGMEITLEAYVMFYSGGSADYPMIIAKGSGQSASSNDYGLLGEAMTSSPTIHCMLRTDGGDISQYGTSGDLTTDIWHHVAAVYDGTNTNVYIDGHLNRRQNQGGGVLDPRSQSSYQPRIGMSGGGGTQSDAVFYGEMGKVAIYNKALSQANIAQLAADPFGPIRMKRRVKAFVPTPPVGAGQLAMDHYIRRRAG